jgi:hypothetical protein
MQDYDYRASIRLGVANGNRDATGTGLPLRVRRSRTGNLGEVTCKEVDHALRLQCVTSHELRNSASSRYGCYRARY